MGEEGQRAKRIGGTVSQVNVQAQFFYLSVVGACGRVRIL